MTTRLNATTLARLISNFPLASSVGFVNVIHAPGFLQWLNQLEALISGILSSGAQERRLARQAPPRFPELRALRIPTGLQERRDRRCALRGCLKMDDHVFAPTLVSCLGVHNGCRRFRSHR